MTSRRIWQAPLLHRIIICLVFGLAITPILPWVQFSGGMENFNVATAQESQRDGHWFMPYLGLHPRLAKPPLVHWITALGIRSVPSSLAWGARGPSILALCGLLLAVYELGRTLEDWPLGLAAAFICGTTLLFLKFAWQASYDLHLALWVAVANWQLARATFKGRLGSGCALAGAAVGLGIMAKGPQATLQSVVPWAVWMLWTRKDGRGAGLTKPLLLGLGLMLAICLPWTIYAFWINHHMLATISDELSFSIERETENNARWHAYIVFFPLMLPWLAWLITGFLEIIRQPVRNKFWLPVLWLVLPILVMTFFPERKDRYLLPMDGAASILAAYGVLRHLPRFGAWTPLQRFLVILHGVFVAAIVIGLAVGGVWVMRTADGARWYSYGLAAAFLAAAALIAAVGLLIYSHNRAGFVGATVVLMLMSNAFFLWGYKDSDSGRSRGLVLARQILDRYPNADIYDAAPHNRAVLPLEVLIYLNRDVPDLPDPAKLAPSSKPQVLIYPPSYDAPFATPPIPAGFHMLAQMKINTGLYTALVREPS